MPPSTGGRVNIPWHIRMMGFCSKNDSTDTHNRVNALDRRYVVRKEADTNEGLPCDSIYIKFTNSHRSSVIIEVTEVVSLQGWGALLIRKTGGNLLGVMKIRCISIHKYLYTWSSTLKTCVVYCVFTHQLFFFFWLCRVTSGIWVAQPGIKLVPPAVKPWYLNHWPTSKSQHQLFLFFKIFFFWCGTFLKSLLNLFYNIISVLCLVFWPRGMRDLGSPIRRQGEPAWGALDSEVLSTGLRGKFLNIRF